MPDFGARITRFAGLIPAYARYGNFGNAFVDTRFLHIAHNLDTSYEGRLYPAVRCCPMPH